MLHLLRGARGRLLFDQSTRRSRANTSLAAAAPPSMPSTFTIAVDGPAASGKGTLARRLAQYFSLRYLDTGLLYRAVGAEALRRGIALDDETGAAQVARSLDPARVGADDATPLRTDQAAQAASKVSALPAVRAALLSAQRDFAAASLEGAVLDGRDIGTVVCPDAAAKIFVTASAEVRAERRWLELQRRAEAGGGGNAAAAPSLEAVLGELRARDARDAGRAVSPLKAAEDAFLLDTSGMDADAAFEAARAYVEEKRRRRARDKEEVDGA
jgi:cytidylate kinase